MTPSTNSVTTSAVMRRYTRHMVIPYQLKSDHLALHRIIVGISGFLFSLALLLCVAQRSQFHFVNENGIVGWVSEHHYPKQQEMIDYAGALVLIPAVLVIVGSCWILLSRCLARYLKLSINRALRLTSFSFLPFLSCAFLINQFPNIRFHSLLSSCLAVLGLYFLLMIVARRTIQSHVKHPIPKGCRFVFRSLLESETTISETSALFAPPHVFHRINTCNWTTPFLVFISGISIGYSWIRLFPPTMAHSSIWGRLCASVIISFGLWVFVSVFCYGRTPSISPKNALVLSGYHFIPSMVFVPLTCFTRDLTLILVVGMVLYCIAQWFVTRKINYFLSHVDTQHIERQKRYLYFFMIPLFFIAYFLVDVSIHGEIDFFHESERLVPMTEMMRGKVPFRDIYITHGLFINALRPYIAGKMIAPTLEALRRIETSAYILGYIFAYFFALNLFRFRITAVFILLILSGENYWVFDRQGVFLLALTFLVCYLKRYRKVWLYVSGATCGIAFFYSLEVGLYSLFTGITFLVCKMFLEDGCSFDFHSRKILPLLTFIAGVFSATAPIIMYFAAHHAFIPMILNMKSQVTEQIAIWGLPFPPLKNLMGQLPVSGLQIVTTEIFEWYLCVLILLATFCWLITRIAVIDRKERHPLFRPLLVLIGGIFLFRTALGRSDHAHLIFGGTLVWFLAFWFIEAAFILLNATTQKIVTYKTKMKNRKMRWVDGYAAQYCIVAVFVALFLVFSISLLYFMRNPVRCVINRVQRINHVASSSDVPHQDVIGRISIPHSQASHIQQITAYIKKKTKPHETIFDFTNQGIWYSLSGRTTPSVYNVIIWSSNYERQRETIRAIEKFRTPLILYQSGTWTDAIDGVSNAKRLPIIDAYIRKNYQRTDQVDGMTFYERKKPL